MGGPRTLLRQTESTEPVIGARPWWRRPLRYRFPLEFMLCGAFFWLYLFIRSLTGDDAGEAFANGRKVMHLEEAFGVFNEAHLQDLLLRSRGVVELLNRYYVMVHFSATVAFLVWAYRFHNRFYVTMRNLFLAVTGSALVIHVLVPLAPPRMFPSRGFVDTLQVYGPQIYPTNVSDSVANQFAAVPSLHFGWAVLVAAGIIAIKRSRLSIIAIAHPIVTLLAIVGTGNHYWTDAAAALALIVAAVGVRRAYLARDRLATVVVTTYRFARRATI